MVFIKRILAIIIAMSFCGVSLGSSNHPCQLGGKYLVSSVAIGSVRLGNSIDEIQASGFSVQSSNQYFVDKQGQSIQREIFHVFDGVEEFATVVLNEQLLVKSIFTYQSFSKTDQCMGPGNVFDEVLDKYTPISAYLDLQQYTIRVEVNELPGAFFLLPATEQQINSGKVGLNDLPLTEKIIGIHIGAIDE